MLLSHRPSLPRFGLASVAVLALVTALVAGCGSTPSGGTSTTATGSTAGSASATTSSTTASTATSESASPNTYSCPDGSVRTLEETGGVVVCPTSTPTAAARVTYKPLTKRQWALIAKTPDKFIGQGFVVYGAVTQFDAATGTDTFRADVNGVNTYEEYQTIPGGTFDGDNTLLTSQTADLSGIVEKDVFRAAVLVLGSFSYDTQIGGNTTVPHLQVDSIKILASTD